MIHVGEKNINRAWRESLRRLYDDGKEIPEKNLYRSSPAAIEVEDTRDEHYDELYPLPVSEISAGNRYLVTGGSDGEMDDEVGEIYRKRLFGGGPLNDGESDESQIERIISYLQEDPHGQNALASLWSPEDMERGNPPDAHSISFHIADGYLDAHLHLRKSDGYRKLLPEMSRFATLQHYVAGRLGIAPGKYACFIDSLHFRNDDREHVDLLLAP